MMGTLEQDARDQGFAIQVHQTGVTIFPTVENRGMSPEEHRALEKEQRKSLDETRNQLMQQIQDIVVKLREAEKESGDVIREHERLAAEHQVIDIFRPTANAYENILEVNHYLSRLADNVSDRLNLFKEEKSGPVEAALPMASNLPAWSGNRNLFLAFESNLLVDNSDVGKAPIVIELNPNCGKLFGRIERGATIGRYLSDHTMLKPSSAD